MLELFVAFSCYYGQGCSHATTNYFLVHPEVHQHLMIQGQKVLQRTPSLVIRTLTPLATLVQGRLILPITQNLVLQSQNNVISIQFTKEF